MIELNSHESRHFQQPMELWQSRVLANDTCVDHQLFSASTVHSCLKRLTPHIPKYKNIEGDCMCKRGKGGVPFVLGFRGSTSIASFCLMLCQKCWPWGLCCFMGNLSIFEALYWYSFQHEAKDFLRSLRYSWLELSSFLYQLGNVVCWKDGASRQKWFQL